MSTDVEPVIGAWYETEEGEVLTVLGVDEKAGTVEVHYLRSSIDGSIDATDLDSWYDLNLEEIEAPEDWRGSIDDLRGRRRPLA